LPKQNIITPDTVHFIIENAKTKSNAE
jgi:hypothetical protein